MKLSEELTEIETIFIVMMENRSFDHMVGYLSLPPYNRSVEGIKQAWSSNYANVFDRNTDKPWHRSDPYIPVDPPHERGEALIALARTLAALDPEQKTGAVALFGRESNQRRDS